MLEVKCLILRTSPPPPPPPEFQLTMDAETACIVRDLVGTTCGSSPHLTKVFLVLEDHIRMSGFETPRTYKIGGRFSAADPPSVGVWMK